MSLRVGVDVGGTFTKAVAVQPNPFVLRAQAVVPTSHTAAAGVSEGVAAALGELVAALREDAARIELVAFSTTQAMNALLEGDVAKVGVVGLGRAPDLRPARKRTAVGEVELAPGRTMQTEHVFLDVTHGLDDAAADAALAELSARGCTAVAVSGAFAVDAPDEERRVVERARRLGLPSCAGHELSSAYGLELRTVSAAINASILPLVERTAGVVEAQLRRHGIDVPLLVLRGDGGAMSLKAFRRTPSQSVGAGPAAGVAAALHQLRLTDAIVLECGGTSSNVSVVKRGRTALRSLRVMGRPTAIRSVDSWVVGAAGGSMCRLRRHRIVEAGPRSAHVAGLPYACFADPATFRDARLELVAPRVGDPEAYATIRTLQGDRFALTATCAATALGLVAGHAPEAALAAFAPLARQLRTTPEGAARMHLDQAVAKIVDAVHDAVRAHGFGPEVPVVALGGAGRALAGEVGRRTGRPLLAPDHPEVLSSIGAALSLIRSEVVRTATAGDGVAAVAAHEAQHACVKAGAAADTVRVETAYDARTGQVRATATGSVALEAGAAGRAPIDAPAQKRAAAAALDVPEDTLKLVVANDYYRVFCENGRGPVAVVDSLGSVPLCENSRCVICGEGEELLTRLREAVDEFTVSLGVADMLPRVAIMCGARLLDASEARQADDVLTLARSVVTEQGEPAVAVVWR